MSNDMTECDPDEFDPDDITTWPIPRAAVLTWKPNGRFRRVSEYGDGWLTGFEAGLNKAAEIELQRRDSARISPESAQNAETTPAPPETAEGRTEAVSGWIEDWGGGQFKVVVDRDTALYPSGCGFWTTVKPSPLPPPPPTKTTGEVLGEIAERLEKSRRQLDDMAKDSQWQPDRDRLASKASGVALALDCLRGYEQ